MSDFLTYCFLYVVSVVLIFWLIIAGASLWFFCICRRNKYDPNLSQNHPEHPSHLQVKDDFESSTLHVWISILLERTFQEKYSQVARSGKQNKFSELRFIFFGRNYRKVCRWIKRGWLSCGQHIHLSQTFLFFFSQNLFLFPRPCDLRVFLLKCTL